MGRIAAGIATLWACAACGGGGGDGRIDAGADASNDAAVDAAPLPGAFAIGAEYSEVGLGPAHGALGVGWAKPRVELAEWGAIEPNAPTGNVHTYNWSCVDQTVDEYQASGMDLQVYITPKSSWGSVAPQTDIMPRTDRMADYRAWVRAIVERYDGDGTADAPGLRRPIRHWVVAAEWTGFWPSGNAADYLALAAATREEARAASPDALLGMIPFMMIDVFAGDPPTAQYVASRLQDPPPAYRKSTAGMMMILDHPEHFDFVDVHSLGDYTEIAPLLAWMRMQMTQRGYTRPIWIDDAFPISFLANRANWPALHPVTQSIYMPLVDVIADVAKLQEPAYTPAMRWVRAETAKGTIYKVVTAIGEGAAGINLGNTEDWMHDTVPSLRDFNVSLMGAAVAMGMFDVTHAAGYQLCQARTVGPSRPAARNLAVLVAKVGSGPFDTIESLAVSGAGLRGYRFVRGTRTVLVVWNEDRVLQLPTESETPVAVTLSLPGATSAVVTSAMTTPEAMTPATTTMTVTGGQLTLSLTSVPVFVEPTP